MDGSLIGFLYFLWYIYNIKYTIWIVYAMINKYFYKQE